MNREKMLLQLGHEQHVWDMIVIGGGATGLGIAMDASLRGYNVLLLEQSDFAKGTSSRSTKLVHGGVRYLAQGDILLVLEALKERGLLLQNAPHLTRNQTFVIPSYSWWEGIFYFTGLTLYDLLAGKLSLGSSSYLGREKTISAHPSINRQGLKGGVIYHDGQFDDARLAINVAQSAAENGACLLNYMKVTSLIKNRDGKISGVNALDLEHDTSYTLQAKVVINATGVFVDDILKMENDHAKPMVRASQGIHLVFERSFLSGGHALMIPKTSDGRVLFAVPWHDKIVIGTTDTLVDHTSLEPHALEQEIAFILDTAGQYLDRKPRRADVLSVFAGLRPLAAPKGKNKSTKEISRSHKLIVSSARLVTITGGKWTTFRKMAEDTVNAAIKTGGLAYVPCSTHHHPIHGHTSMSDHSNHLSIYGSDAAAILELIKSEPELAECLHPSYEYVKAEIVWAARHEMARTIEDVLARRIRILFLDARAAIAMAPEVAQLLAIELSRDQQWMDDQLKSFVELAKGFLLASNEESFTLNLTDE